MRLSDLQEGACCIAEVIFAEGAVLHRLTDIGLTEGTRVRCVRKSFFGDPVVYEIRGTLVALRKETAALVGVVFVK